MKSTEKSQNKLESTCFHAARGGNGMGVISSFQTRPACIEDLDELFALVCELASFEGKDLKTLPVTKDNLKKYGFGSNPCFHVEFAENLHGIAGYVLYSNVFSGHQGTPFLYIDDLYVKPSERGKGMGTGLLKQLA